MENYILANVRTFCRVLNERSPAYNDSKGWSVARNMALWSDYLAFDIMSELAFGKNFGMLERDESHFAVGLISSAAHRHLIVRPTSTVPVTGT